MSSRLWFWASALGLAIGTSSLAQESAPPESPSPLLLVDGVREAGMPELALEYLQEVEKKLSPADRVLVPLARAQCLLDAAENEPDEGTRTSMIGQAKEGFNSFLIANSKHPRASEASLALARLTSIEARAQLNRGRRMEVPPSEDPGHDEALKQQRVEMNKARPMFLQASKQFAQAAEQLKARLKDAKLDAAARQRLTREVFDADLASAINKYYLADTFLVTGSKDTLERDKYLEEARKPFAELAKGPPTNRNVWVAKAWMAEILADQGKLNEADKEFDAILRSRRVEAAEGKRLVQFFQVRRKYFAALGDPTVGKLRDATDGLRSWLRRYGNARRPTPEMISARYYRALGLQLQVELSMGPPPKTPGATAPKLSENQRRLLQESERIYRELGQTDNDYTARANRNRMVVVRKLLGEADRPPSDYAQFEDAQMAALIQMAKLQDAERAHDRAMVEQDEEAPFWLGAYQKADILRTREEIEDRKYRVVALLEHARSLATEKDSPNDVTDNLLRLVYFYQQTGQPHQAAVLGEYIARSIKTTGGKAATAGLLALRGYATAGGKLPNLGRAAEAATAVREVFPLFPEIAPETLAEQEQRISALVEEGRKADRDRAIAFARFLDEKFPNDSATDTVRHQLALLLYQRREFEAAFDAIIKVRPGYSSLYTARQFEAYLASQIVLGKDSTAPPQRRREIFHQTLADLGKLVKPGTSATAEDATGFLGCRLRLAQLYLNQWRADPKAEENPQTRGYKLAQDLADEVLGLLPTYENLTEKDKKDDATQGLTLEGFELKVQALDLRTRAIYLRAKSLVDDSHFDAASETINPVAQSISKGGRFYTTTLKEWAGGQGDDPDGKTKAEIARTAANIDKVRRDIVMVGFKLGVVQGKKDEAAKMLELLKTAGGGIAENKSTLELMARELAAQIPGLRKAGKNQQAQALGEGLSILLKEFTSLKELETSTILFLGQTFYTVGQYEEALAQIEKIKVPVPPPSLKHPSGTPWWEADPLKIADGQDRRKFQGEIRDYRFAQLYRARTLRGLGRLDEAEKLLVEAIGDSAKKGYAYASLDFRKELAYTFEAKGAAQTDPKMANTQWAKALREWMTLFQLAQRAVREIKPKSELEPGTPEEQVKRIKNDFFEAFFEPQRVVVTANAQLIKDPTKLESSYGRVAKSFTDLERVNKFNDPIEIDTPDGKVKTTVGAELMSPDVARRYRELIESNPALKSAYTKAGGKFFLAPPSQGD